MRSRCSCRRAPTRAPTVQIKPWADQVLVEPSRRSEKLVRAKQRRKVAQSKGKESGGERVLVRICATINFHGVVAEHAFGFDGSNSKWALRNRRIEAGRALRSSVAAACAVAHQDVRVIGMRSTGADITIQVSLRVPHSLQRHKDACLFVS